ncbi:MAG: hypothetical protein WCD70_03635 [Alphaproteobacteria bacterium]
MIKNFLRGSVAADDARLRDVLRQYDPVMPPAGGSLAALEADIFAQIDRRAEYPASTDVGVFAGFFQQGWTARTAAFASVIIIALGFIVGQVTSGEVNAPLLAGNLSLVAFADEMSGQSVSATDTSWGENDDNAE